MQNNTYYSAKLYIWQFRLPHVLSALNSQKKNGSPKRDKISILATGHKFRNPIVLTSDSHVFLPGSPCRIIDDETWHMGSQ